MSLIRTRVDHDHTAYVVGVKAALAYFEREEARASDPEPEPSHVKHIRRARERAGQ